MLTKGERSVLEKLAIDPQVIELVQAIPGGWWIELDEIDGRICWSLMRKVLISEHQYSAENFKRYYINEWGRNALLSNTACTRLETGAANADSESNPAVSSG